MFKRVLQRPSIRFAALAAAFAIVPTSSSVASVGDLVQKTGLDACITDTSPGSDCTASLAPLGNAEGVAVSPDGKNAYVVAQASAAIVIYDRNPATGILTVKSGTKGCISKTGSGGICVTGNDAFNGINSVVVSPDGKNVYATSADPGAVLVFDRNNGNGELALKAGTASCFTDTGSSGACTAARGVAGAGGFYNSSALKVSADGKNVYVTGYNESAIAIFDRNSSTGALTQKAGAKGCISIDGKSNSVATQCAVGRGFNGIDTVVVSPDGKNVYAATWDENGVTAFARSTTNGELTQLAGTSGCISNDGSSGACVVGKALGNGNSITISPDGKNVYVAAGLDKGAVAVLDRNSATGVLTQKADPNGCIAGSITGCSVSSTRDNSVMQGAYDIIASKDGKNVYLISTKGTLMVLDRNRTTGALSVRDGAANGSCIGFADFFGECTVGKKIGNPQGVALSPDGKNVYVASTGTSAILTFDRTRASSAYTVRSITKSVKRRAVVITVQLNVPGDGTVTVTVKDGSKNVCVKSVTTAAAGNVTVVCSLGTATRTKLKRKNLSFKVITGFTPTGQEQASKTQTISVHKSR